MCSNAQAWLVSARRRGDKSDSSKVSKFQEELVENHAVLTATTNLARNDTNTLDLEEFITRLSQRLIVPSSFGFIVLLLSYFVIGLTTSFDSIRFYSFYAGK